MTPSFILAGAQRCGTTSLFRALMEHPVILSPVYHKGVNYFDLNYDKGWSWYQGHFPVRAFAAVRTRHNGDVPVTFEASGYYMYHPHAAARLAHDLPQVKVLVMLRDPIERHTSPIGMSSLELRDGVVRAGTGAGGRTRRARARANAC